jgi:DNA-directed RNA polymerase specialized sigma24 family protein
MAQIMIDSAFASRDGLFEEIVRTLDLMPEDLREIFILSHYECRGAREIASLMHGDPAELELKLNRANRIFYRSLRSGGGEVQG